MELMDAGGAAIRTALSASSPPIRPGFSQNMECPGLRYDADGDALLMQALRIFVRQ